MAIEIKHKFIDLVHLCYVLLCFLFMTVFQPIIQQLFFKLVAILHSFVYALASRLLNCFDSCHVCCSVRCPCVKSNSVLNYQEILAHQ